MIKAISFDFWSTLYRPQQVDYRDRLNTLRFSLETETGLTIPHERMEKANRSAWQTWNQIWQNEHRTLEAEAWLALVLKTLAIEIASQAKAVLVGQLEDSLVEMPPILLDDARAVIPQLAERYPLGIISDTGLSPGRVLKAILDKDELIPYFTQLTFSNEVGYSKPHPYVFNLTLDALGAGPSEAFHVGDLLRTDIAGAQGVGMRGVQYAGVDYDRSLDSVKPDALIRSHHELWDLIERWT